jgi:transcriptional regulator with XRE-family HTH domain
VNGADIVIKLRDLRRFTGLTQRDLARKSRVHEKTISSYETGQRIGSMKLQQLQRILRACNVTEADFFTVDMEELLGAAANNSAPHTINWYAERILAILEGAPQDRLSAFEVLGAVRSRLEAQHADPLLRMAS